MHVLGAVGRRDTPAVPPLEETSNARAAPRERKRAPRGQPVVRRPPKLYTTFRSAACDNNVVECFYIWGATSAPISAVKDANTTKPWVSFGSSTRRNGVTIVKRGDVRWAELDKRCPWHVCVVAPASAGE